jgi:hypothetical protein
MLCLQSAADNLKNREKMNSLTAVLWARLRQKLGIDRFSNRYLASYPRLIRVFNIVLPTAASVAAVFGIVLLSWQVISLAKAGEVRLSLPEANSTKKDDFTVRTTFTAKQDRDPFNVVFKLDGQVIESRVSAAIKTGESREYNFSSGVNGENKFDRNLLSPGQHTLKIEAHTGTAVGQGAEIDTDETNFTVTDVHNLASWAEFKTYSIDKLPLYSTTPRNALKPHSLQSTTADVSSSGLHSLGNFLVPTVEAATRHGDFNVHAPPGIKVTVKSVASVLAGCKDNSVNADADGKARFRDCEVSKAQSDGAVYEITLGDTPPGYKLDGGRTRQVTVYWNTTTDFYFGYSVIINTQPQSPPAASTPATNPATSNPTTVPVTVPPPVYNYAPDSGAFISLTNLGTTSATVDAFAAQMQNNIVVNYLREVYVTVDGVKTSSVTQFSPYATQRSLGLSYPNLADGKDHDLAFIALSQNGKTSWINIKITGQKATSNSTNNSSSGSTISHDTGGIAVTVYAHTAKGQKLDKDNDPHIGNVNVSTHNIGDNVGQCDPATGLTDNVRDHVKNFGQIKFDKCPVALSSEKNHAKKYTVSITVPSGFLLDDDFNKISGATPSSDKTVITREVDVQKDQDTDVSFMLVGSNSNTVSQGPTDVSTKVNTANITVYVLLDYSKNTPQLPGIPKNYYDDVPLFLVPNVPVTATGASGNTKCEVSAANTGIAKDQYYGVAILKNCPLAADGGSKQYDINITSPGDLAPVTNLPTRVTATAGSINKVTITLRQK